MTCLEPGTRCLVIIPLTNYASLHRLLPTAGWSLSEQGSELPRAVSTKLLILSSSASWILGLQICTTANDILKNYSFDLLRLRCQNGTSSLKSFLQCVLIIFPLSSSQIQPLIGVLFAKEDLFSPQRSFDVFSSLCRVEDSWSFLSLCRNVYRCLPCSALG